MRYIGKHRHPLGYGEFGPTIWRDLAITGIRHQATVNEPPQCTLTIHKTAELRTGDDVVVLMEDDEGNTYEVFQGTALPTRVSFSNQTAGMTVSAAIEHPLDYLRRFNMEDAISSVASGGLQDILLFEGPASNFVPMTELIRKLDDNEDTQSTFMEKGENGYVRFNPAAYLVYYLPAIYTAAYSNRLDNVDMSRLSTVLKPNLDRIASLFQRIRTDDTTWIDMQRAEYKLARDGIKQVITAATLQNASYWNTFMTILGQLQLDLAPLPFSVWDAVDPDNIEPLDLATIRPRRPYVPAAAFVKTPYDGLVSVFTEPEYYVYGIDRITKMTMIPVDSADYVSSVGVNYELRTMTFGSLTQEEKRNMGVWTPNRGNSENTPGKFKRVTVPPWMDVPTAPFTVDKDSTDEDKEAAINASQSSRSTLLIRWLASKWMSLSTNASRGSMTLQNPFDRTMTAGRVIKIDLRSPEDVAQSEKLGRTIGIVKTGVVRSRVFSWNQSTGSTNLDVLLSHLVDANDEFYKYVEGELYG